jgi:hypothetical protein
LNIIVEPQVQRALCANKPHVRTRKETKII